LSGTTCRLALPARNWPGSTSHSGKAAYRSPSVTATVPALSRSVQQCWGNPSRPCLPGPPDGVRGAGEELLPFLPKWDAVTSQVIGGLDVPGTLRAEFWVTCRRAGGLTWRGGRGSRSPALWRRRADPAQAMDKSGRPGSSLDRIGVRRRPAIASGPLLMILLFTRCLLVCPGTTRRHPALAGIRSRWEVHEPATTLWVRR